MEKVIFRSMGLTCTLILFLSGSSCTRNNVLPPPKPKPNFNIKDSVLVPNITINHQPDSTYSVDMDHDGVMDIQFTLTAGGWWYGPHYYTCLNAGVYALNSNTSVSVGDTSGGQYANYTLNSIINGSSFWSPHQELFVCMQGGGGYWAGTANSTYPGGFIGVRIVKGGKNYFGWVQLICDGNSFTFEQYAMDANSNPYILAGQKH
jgi:hypothetical protein